MPDDERRAIGLTPLPGSLDRALDLFKADQTVCGWLGPEFLEAYLRLKMSEIAAVKGQSDKAICSRYAAAY